MTLRAKHNGRMRIVSKAMARVLARRGIEVVDDSVAAETLKQVDAALDAPATGAIAVREVLSGEKLEDAATTGTPIDAPADAPALDASAPIGPPFEYGNLGTLRSELRADEEVFNADSLVETAAVTPAAEPTLVHVEFPKSGNLRTATLGTDGVLLVEFKSGAKCAYANFTAELWAEWQAAPSAGSWFHQNVRTKSDRHPVLATAAAGEG